MRICIFTPTFLPMVGGAERDADVIARGLQARGHEVSVLALDMGKLPALPYPVRQYRRPPAQHLWPEVLTAPLLRAYRAWKFEVVLAFYAYPTGYIAARMKRVLPFGVVVTPRGGDLYPNFHSLRKPRVRRIIREGYRRADRIVSISQWLTDRMREETGGRLPPVDLVYNGVDLEQHDRLRDEARARPPALPVTRPFVLHLARVTPVKRQSLAVEAVHRLRRLFESRGLRYAIVGTGEAFDDLKAQVQRLGLEKTVLLLGSRVGVEKSWLFHNAEFMVSTSREEGLGNVLLESMASGLPMLGSDIGPHRELIAPAPPAGNGRAAATWGRLFRSGDLDDLCVNMQAMIEDDLAPLRREALARRDRFTLDAMITGYESACRMVARAPEPALDAPSLVKPVPRSGV